MDDERDYEAEAQDRAELAAERFDDCEVDDGAWALWGKA